MAAEVWIVDDEPLIRAALLAALAEAGYAAQGFENAERLYTALLDTAEAEGRQLPGLIILDERLPDESGDQIVRSLRERPQFRDIDFLFLTAVSADDAGRLTDLAPVLRKPFDFRDLVEMVEQSIPREEEPPPGASSAAS